MAIMGDHQDSFHRTYDRSWDEIEDMLFQAEKKMNSDAESRRPERSPFIPSFPSASALTLFKDFR